MKLQITAAQAARTITDGVCAVCGREPIATPAGNVVLHRYVHSVAGALYAHATCVRS